MKISEAQSRHDPRIGHLHFSGELNASDCQAVNVVFQGQMNSGKRFIIVIMEEVTFISSPFLGALMGCKLRLTEQDGNMVLVGLGYPMKEKLFQMGADRIFHFYPDIPSAYHRFNWEHAEGVQALRLEFPPKLPVIPAVRCFLSNVARQKGYSSRDTFRIETLVDEIANNAIEHGDPDQSIIYLEAKISRRKMELVVRNKTHMDKVSQLRELVDSNLDVVQGPSTRGRGLALIKLISHSMDVSIDQTGTCVRVTKLREDA